MMELSERIEELLDEHDFSVCGDISERYGEKGRYDIELETYSPEGEDVLVSLTYDGTEKDFIREFNDYAEGFDAEDHAEMWIECRGKNGVPDSIKDLLEDAEWIKERLQKALAKNRQCLFCCTKGGQHMPFMMYGDWYLPNCPIRFPTESEALEYMLNRE